MGMMMIRWIFAESDVIFVVLCQKIVFSWISTLSLQEAKRIIQQANLAFKAGWLRFGRNPSATNFWKYLEVWAGCFSVERWFDETRYVSLCVRADEKCWHLIHFTLDFKDVKGLPNSMGPFL